MKVSGTLVDIHAREIFPAVIIFKNGIISAIKRVEKADDRYILPGLIDSHIHIESSMLTPGNFAMASVPHGTIGVVSDPHEIANVLGIQGIEYMIKDAERVPLKFWFGAPSCVPATDFETNGGKLELKDIIKLLKRNEVKYLAEMMNFPGVIYDDIKVKQKLGAARNLGKRIDGHAPGLTGINLKKYIDAGISTDHECSTIEEARKKISMGMKIQIREGSAARNLDTLKELYRTNPESIMLCSDDLHPEMLEKGHINKLIAKLISEGYNKFDVIRSATINPAEHYNLEAGMLRVGDNADFIVTDNLEIMNILETWINGKRVYEHRNIKFKYLTGAPLNIFNCTRISEEEISVKNKNQKYRVIQAFNGELRTKEFLHNPAEGEKLETIVSEDILKIVVKDRYKDSHPAVGFIKGFGLKEGAFAGSVAHDSHNIIAVGTNDRDIVSAINEIIRLKGGLVVVKGGEICSLQLDVAGIMSRQPCHEVASSYEKLTKKVKKLGCKMSAPFMTLSFMALLVIPEIKLSDQGLFDGIKFCPVPLFVE
ncbi:MAG: adenine deaminase [Bacteroidia bacterium]|nr:adenine deaminase [Bacteroidia bacterium]